MLANFANDLAKMFFLSFFFFFFFQSSGARERGPPNGGPPKRPPERSSRKNRMWSGSHTQYCSKIRLGLGNLPVSVCALKQSACEAQHVYKKPNKNRSKKMTIFNIFALAQFHFAIFLRNFDENLSEFRDQF